MLRKERRAESYTPGDRVAVIRGINRSAKARILLSRDPALLIKLLSGSAGDLTAPW